MGFWQLKDYVWHKELPWDDRAAGFLRDSVTRRQLREWLAPSSGQYVHMPVCVHTHVVVMPVCMIGIGRRCCISEVRFIFSAFLKRTLCWRFGFIEVFGKVFILFLGGPLRKNEGIWLSRTMSMTWMSAFAPEFCAPHLPPCLFYQPLKITVCRLSAYYAY